MIQQFKASFHFLSNFHLSDVILDGMIFPSSEHAYQSFKSVDPEWKKVCQDRLITPSKIKQASYLQQLVPDWDKNKLEVMKRVLRAKFAKNPLKTMLLDTGLHELREGNTWNDKYWGVDLDTGEGENHLGRLLMEVREEMFKASIV